MTSRKPGATEPYKPVWASMVEELRLRRELLDEVVAKGSWTEEQRCSAALSMVEPQIESLESALWRAEEELREAHRVLRELTEPKGKGRRRHPEQHRHERLMKDTNFILHCAQLDGKSLSQRDAVKAAMVGMSMLDPNDPTEPGLDAMVRAYQRQCQATKRE